MFFSSWKETRARTVRLSLSSLESRETPTGLLDTLPAYPDSPTLVTGPVATVPSLPTLPGNPGTPPIAVNTAPVLTSLEAITGENGKVTFSGTVTDDNLAAGVQITIVANDGSFRVSATVNADGTFSVSTTVAYEGMDVYVTGTATDSSGSTSNPLSTFFTPSSN